MSHLTEKERVRLMDGTRRDHGVAASFFQLLKDAGCTYCAQCRCYLQLGHRHTSIVGPFLMLPLVRP